MPYIREENRKQLDPCIDHTIICIKNNLSLNTNAESSPFSKQKLTNEEFNSIAGDINYTFSRILGGLMGDISYSKIAIITGVLENIKQEFYRRAASPYEDKKIVENGDIQEYRRIN